MSSTRLKHVPSHTLCLASTNMTEYPAVAQFQRMKSKQTAPLLLGRRLSE